MKFCTLIYQHMLDILHIYLLAWTHSSRF